MCNWQTEATPFFNAPVHSFPDSIPESQRTALLQNYTITTRDILVPALGGCATTYRPSIYRTLAAVLGYRK